MRALSRAITCMALLISLPAAARLGETLEQLEARFGKGKNMSALSPSVKPPITAHWRFVKNGIAISAYFIGDKCGYVNYQPETTGRGPKPFPKSNVNKLLAANSGGSKWIAVKKPKNIYPRVRHVGTTPKAAWRRADGNAYAMSFGTQMGFLSKEYVEAIRRFDVAAAKAEAEATDKRLEGF